MVDGRRIEQKQVNVGPEATASVVFSYRFDSAADHAIEVRAAGDSLDVDNHRFLAMPVRQTIRAVHRRAALGQLVPRRGRLPGRGAYARGPAGQPGAVQAEVAPESAIMERHLGRYQCVLACNVAQFTASEARVLDAYLRSGGNLVFFLGDQVSPDRYNHELGGAGQDRQGRAGHRFSPSLWERGRG